MTVIEKVSEHFRVMLGQKKEEHLGTITDLMIKRYALAIGDDNPLYSDREYARKRGYEDIIAPPNMVASIVDWSVGLKEEDLHEDGTPKTGGILPSNIQGIRVMGGGEMKKFINPIVAGTDVYVTTEVIDTHVKEGKKGPIAFLVIKNTFKDAKGKIYCISERTVIAR
ncbi:hypothetical protein D1B33_07940 [Lysinibacillus yapensis]|uniref:FAS1-like dehydratase domain-containing protein n=1 Tax=Ureibacillus yapensis TaxID=2304605 RepID=A0A396S981_9BACL|nr:MaoC family dehydratase [Lysinibacillus yapensis]RHW37464.1 hypothetical protein D1B33_07940 [Lysinibacillus yapensis]